MSSVCSLFGYRLVARVETFAVCLGIRVDINASVKFDGIQVGREG